MVLRKPRRRRPQVPQVKERRADLLKERDLMIEEISIVIPLQGPMAANLLLPKTETQREVKAPNNQKPKSPRDDQEAAARAINVLKDDFNINKN